MVGKLIRTALGVIVLVSLATVVGCASTSPSSSGDSPSSPDKETVKIGVSFGVGEAIRWVNEQEYMEERAKELGVDIEVRLNKTDEPKTQTQDCIEMIDSGIDVLILIPRNVDKVDEILEYAKEKKVPVVDYARAILNKEVDLFVGYDSNRIGQTLGQYVSELVFEGDYIILSGAPDDNNATLLYEGAMRYIDPIKSNINILLDAPVPGWSAEEAKRMVMEAVEANGNKVDAILAPNDKIAGACREALDELGVTTPVVITGMDAELDAVRRVAAGTQSCTVFMDLYELATTAVTEANNIATGAPVSANADFDNGLEGGIRSNLITGKLITKENLDKMLIETGYFTKEEVYGAV